MLKKTLFVGMTVALAASTIIGCGTDKAEENKSGSGDATEQKDGKAATEADPKELVVGFIPSQDAETLSAKAKPMGDMLSKELGIPVKVTVTTNFNALVEAMAAKKVDVGFLSPVNYVFAKDKKKAVTLLLQTSRKGSSSYKSMLVKRADDNTINKVEDVKGKRVAFVDGSSAAGYTFPALMLKKVNINPETDVKAIMAGGHDKGLQALYRGDVDVAAVFDDARDRIEKEYPDVKTKLVPFAKSEDIPNDTVSIRNGFSEAFNKKVADAFIKIMKTEEGKKVGNEIYNFDDLVPGKDESFNIIRDAVAQMNLQPK